MPDTIQITEKSDFYRASRDGTARFYPKSGENSREIAMGIDPNASIISGFAVYDTEVSTDYAVAIYASRELAENYKPAKAKEVPTSLFSDDEKPAKETYARKPKKKR